MKDFLEKQIADKKKKIEELRSKIDSAQTVDEVRGISSQIEELRVSVSEFEEQLRSIEENEGKKPEEHRGENLDPQATFRTTPQKKTEEERHGLDRSDINYRKAFMEYVQRGTINSGLIQRAGGDPGFTITPEIGMLIPETMLNRLIEKTKGIYGTIYSRVTKISVKGGVKIPMGEFMAQAHWINETTVSPRQKAGEAKDFIEFSYHTLEIRVASSLLSNVVSLDIFEDKIVENILYAYQKEMDMCIINGDGVGKPLGVTKDPRVTNSITLTADDISDWKAWHSKFFATIPLALRGGGEFLFPVSTVERYLRTMHDDVNRPIYADVGTVGLNLPDSGVEGRFNGRRVLFVEPDIIPDFDTAKKGDVIGIMWIPSDYMINTQLQFGMRRYFDEETNQWVNKALTICDGKMVNTEKCILIKKG